MPQMPESVKRIRGHVGRSVSWTAKGTGRHAKHHPKVWCWGILVVIDAVISRYTQLPTRVFEGLLGAGVVIAAGLGFKGWFSERRAMVVVTFGLLLGAAGYHALFVTAVSSKWLHMAVYGGIFLITCAWCLVIGNKWRDFHASRQSSKKSRSSSTKAPSAPPTMAQAAAAAAGYNQYSAPAPPEQRQAETSTDQQYDDEEDDETLEQAMHRLGLDPVLDDAPPMMDPDPDYPRPKPMLDRPVVPPPQGATRYTGSTL